MSDDLCFSDEEIRNLPEKYYVAAANVCAVIHERLPDHFGPGEGTLILLGLVIQRAVEGKEQCPTHP